MCAWNFSWRFNCVGFHDDVIYIGCQSYALTEKNMRMITTANENRNYDFVYEKNSGNVVSNKCSAK